MKPQADDLPGGDELPPPYNPAGDGHPAKYWELLRRNDRFVMTAERVRRLAASPGTNRLKVHKIIGCVRQFNPCAATALEWLCPEPTFIFTRYAERPPHDVECEWVGFTPDCPPPDAPDWRKPSARPQGAVGGSIRIGPTIWHTNFSTMDSFRLWREDREKLSLFGVDRAWPETPHLFQLQLAHRWSHFEHSGKPGLDLAVEECTFFQGWQLPEFDTKTAEGLARQLEFAALASRLVFAFPKPRYARALDIDKMLEGLGRYLKNRLVCRDEILGTQTDWRVFLAIERNFAEYGPLGVANKKAAIDAAGEELYGVKSPFDAGTYDVQHRKQIVEGYFHAINGDGDTPGWIQKVFPRLPVEIYPSAS
jgi:hypothetical protein